MGRISSFHFLFFSAVGSSAFVTNSLQRSFVPIQSVTRSTPSRLTRFGVFDEIKSAFTADDAQAIDIDRETPIDRWLGISTKSEVEQKAKLSTFVDSMAEENYVTVALKKPMGVVFEENDPGIGGVFVASLAPGGAAAEEGSLRVGDQLVAVDKENVLGLSFDDALGKIVASPETGTSLIVFRGGTSNLYGNLGPADDWLSEFLSK